MACLPRYSATSTQVKYKGMNDNNLNCGISSGLSEGYRPYFPVDRQRPHSPECMKLNLYITVNWLHILVILFYNTEH